ncbi:MAG TPA: hypothetical protein VK468_08000 [Pyrinomonadaceae bacterium]|jgi:hypothetical protein|nr:hypothetical protein [Pyrinomonadaceae bacterium]
MPIHSEQQNPDVNTFNIDGDGDEENPARDEHDRSNEPGENIPVPPDRQPTSPIEEPPETDEPPVRDPNGGVKKIA